MLPSRHIIVSVPLGVGVGFFTNSLFYGLLCLFSGLLIDIDHLIEYLIHYGLNNFDIKKIYLASSKFAKREEEGGLKKLYLIFHAGEFALLFWLFFIFFKNNYFLSIALGYSGHLILDASNNVLRPEAYFIITRIRNNFKTKRLLKENATP